MKNVRTQTKSILSVLLILLMLTTLASLVLAVDPETYSGSLGKNLTWTLDDQGTLTIRGTGNWTNSTPGFEGDQRIKKVVLESGITEIDRTDAFNGCKNLESAVFPSTLKSISMSMFYGCSSLESVSLPDSAINISMYAFVNTALFNNDSNWDNDVLYIGNHLIQAKETLNGSYTIKAGTLDIANGAFYRCSELTNVTIPGSVKQIGGQAFSGAGLVSLNIPNGVSFIGDGAFEQCYWLETINLPSSITTIGFDTFCDCHSLETISIPSNVTKIGEDAFKDCGYYDNEENWSNDVLYIGNCLISAKNTLSGIYSVKSGTRLLAEYAFDGCKELTNISLPKNIEVIGDGAFQHCEKLENISIPNGITRINNYLFNSCMALKSIDLPNSITELGKGAFRGCANLGSIQIPNGVTKIEDAAFSFCESLSEVTLPDSLTDFGEEQVFSSCKSLTTIRVPSCVTTLGWGSFINCYNLKSIEIPNTVTQIGHWAFSGCSSLMDVFFLGTIEEWNSIEIRDANGPLLNATKHFVDGSSTHIHTYFSSINTPATCTEKGVMTYTCSCGDTYTKEIEIDSTNHAALNENGDCPRCGKHIKDVERPTEPTTKPSEEKPIENLNFFQRIIEWFRNLFAKLFGR